MHRKATAVAAAIVLAWIGCDRAELNRLAAESTGSTGVRFSYAGRPYDGASIWVQYAGSRRGVPYRRFVRSGILFVESGAPDAGVSVDFHGNTTIKVVDRQQVSVGGRPVVFVLREGLMLIPDWQIPEDVTDPERIGEWIVAKFSAIQDEQLAAVVTRCGKQPSR